MIDRVKIADTSAASGALMSIQALRGMSVMGIVFIHVQFYFSAKFGMPGFLPQFNIGAACVDVFFVISGFIMVYASERLFGQPGGMRTYFLRRIARIVPMYWAATTVILIYLVLQYGSVGAAMGGASLSYVIASYAFIPYATTFHPSGWPTPLHGVGWTLNYEMFFYTLFGLCIALSRRMLMLVLSSLFCMLIAVHYLWADLPNPWAFWSNPLIIEFVFGMLIAGAYREGIRLRGWLAHALVFCALAVLGWSWYQAHFFDPSSWLRVPIWGVPALLIVGGFALSDKPVARNLFWRTFGFLGDASYSIYLVHTITLGVPRLLFSRWIDPTVWPWFYVAAMLAVMMAASLLFYLYVEKPVIAALQRRIDDGGRPQVKWPRRAEALAINSPASG